MKQNKINKKSICSKVKLFSVCIGITAVCMLTTVGILDYTQPTGAMHVKEASAFNGISGFSVQQVNASENSISDKMHVIPLGTSFGIKLFTDGVIVVSLSDIDTGDSISCPAQDAGIKVGDYILKANGEEITTNSSLAKLIGASDGQDISLTVKRDNEIFETVLTPIFHEGAFKAGMWIRDSAAGIGTLTFYNPDNGVFAGLGHGICDMDTNGIMTLGHGEPAEITLCGIVRGQINEPGQLQGYFASDEPMGELLANNETGVYGTLNEKPAGDLIEVAKKNEVKTGDAKLLVSVDSNGPQYYDAKIESLNSDNQKTKNMVIKITDERLLALTGGIVQGMSGCPIIQDNKLVGAVTHVFTEDPQTGYGIYAQTMFEESDEFSLSN